MKIKAQLSPYAQLSGAIKKPRIMAQMGFLVREIVRDRRQFEISFHADRFEQVLGLMRLLIPSKAHALGNNYAVRKICRTDEGAERNIAAQWEILVNGDFVLLSHDAFDGKIILEEV